MILHYQPTTSFDVLTLLVQMVKSRSNTSQVLQPAVTQTTRWTSTPRHQLGCLCHLNSLLWPWPLTSSI